MSKLFTPYTLKSITMRNRIAVPPMCQYMAEDGVPNDWHLVHYAQMARGGVGLIVVEATGVSPEGRISPNCLGIWNDKQAAEHAKIAAAIKKAGCVPGIQIAHAGRKANANRPWEGDNHLEVSDPRYWEIIGPSPIAFGGGILPRVPREMTKEDIERVKADFVAAAKRALDAGYEWLELHFAHGYLAQSFFSVHANHRTDEYGGDADGRGRFLLETMEAVRAVWPDHLPFSMRFGVIEFDDRDEVTLQESIELIKKFKEGGLDFISVSLGFNIPDAKIPWGPAFMAPIADHIKKETGLPVTSAWGFGRADLASAAVESGQLDIVSVGRAHLANPHWTYATAMELGIDKPSWVLPAPYAHWLEQYKL
ncbi:NADH:flavin oxidoreductase/NADH oxidase [Sulfurovum sp. zt1-1]|uniref:NADH:flavin oxidoreductase/NADH oxidase n=1 Tax=Sulfurovum zhangzhouensis TaxID=3019067 RepID=A0ABT7QVN2_9BACT|nr:NADH:flavin oxidoreductase/NADH oxidase [Sulfurovum zhangzhouensis]MDM5270900.1 NADH:flavin oxidoreductase/NADH oxidase [Sulfurovum zhangzhouensis]